MDKKIKVEVCVGTTCFILGASELQELDRYLPEELAACTEIVGSTCLGLCKQSNYGHAPFVRINEDEVVANATVDSVIDAIKNYIAKMG